MGGVGYAVLDRLEAYIAHLAKWQRAINLVGPKTLEDPWRRHILDSAQLVPLLPSVTTGLKIADLGSGAGLPGLVLAIMTDADVQMIESDQRKSTFIREAARITETSVVVHTGRIEAVAPCQAEIVTARALAPMQRLLPWVYRHLAPGGKSLLLKGAEADEELTLSAKKWTMSMVRKQSLSNASGTVLIIDELAPITDV
ncbi:16S rRNA (guanine(527)-N(7))-methyltransferase RsmG [Thalassospiraceae bacterium LMO-JJ14]|nr:16S rRNA (guanine(527)-N(7))-methyltransferase RsmG [Thalassospiraceae bacterium LMO-JJ14]